MKRFFLLCALLLSSGLVFSSEVDDLLQKAMAAYTSGDVTTTLQHVDSARKILEKEKMASTGEDYEEVTNWDVVKMKKSQYIGKKVKVKASLFSIGSDGTVVLSGAGSMSNPYDASLQDTLLGLKKYTKYTFYGTVIDDRIWGPSLHIEAIE